MKQVIRNRIQKVMIVAFMSFVSMQSAAQLKTGFKTGMNFFRMKFTHQKELSYSPSFYGGLFVNYREKKFSVQMDALGFTEMSKTKELKSGMVRTQSRYFLRIPFTLQFQFTQGIRIATGPQLSVPVAQAKNPDWRWAVSGSYQLPFCKKLSVNGRYSLAMGNQSELLSTGVFQMGIAFSQALSK